MAKKEFEAFDYFGLKAKIGDLVMVQHQSSKGFQKRFIVRITKQFGEIALITVDSKTDFDAYCADKASVNSWKLQSTRSSFIILDPGTGLPKIGTGPKSTND